MVKSLNCFIVALIFSISLNSQRAQPGQIIVNQGPLELEMTTRWLQNASNKIRITANTIKLEDIEGSVYYNDKFIEGDVFYLDEIFDTYPMRYNAYNDEIEIKRTEGSLLEAVFRSPTLTCVVDKEYYIYAKHFDNKGEVQEGYLIRLTEVQKYVLYEKRSKVYKEGRKAATSMHPTYPPKFEDRHDYFISSNGELPIQFKGSKKELTTIFGSDMASTLKSFIKENKLKLNQEQDLIKLLEFVNSHEAVN